MFHYRDVFHYFNGGKGLSFSRGTDCVVSIEGTDCVSLEGSSLFYVAVVILMRRFLDAVSCFLLPL